mmetsp:Transcript_18130/g.50368  ORF Transcript_18130/g.50368 Transcript_18130/m.50368 type:complete len:232 (-) Transcript_18130:869-1564(-)
MIWWRRRLLHGEPLVGHRLLDRQPVLRVHGHELPHELLGLERYLGPLVYIELVPPVQDLLIQAILLERRDAAKHDVQDHTQAPHVHLLAVARRLAGVSVPKGVDDLRSEVVGRATEGFAILRFHVLTREAEVSQLRSHFLHILASQQDVLRLQVAMNDVPVVQKLHSPGDVFEKPPSSGFAEATMLEDELQQVAAAKELHGDEKLILRFEPLVDPNDAGVVQAHEHLRLAL